MWGKHVTQIMQLSMYKCVHVQLLKLYQYDSTLKVKKTLNKIKAVTSSFWKETFKKNISVTLYNHLTITIKSN